MATESKPTEAEINSFLDKLRGFRDTLPENDQRLLNAMYFAAMGKQEAPSEEGDEVQSYWVAVNPVGPAGGPGYGYAVGGYGGAAMYGSPWGAAYGAYYPRYW
jgi:hypothetical protein